MTFGNVPNLFTWLWQAFLRPHAAATDSPLGATAETTTLAKLRRVREKLAGQGAAQPETIAAFRALGRLEARLRRPPRLALLGEFHSGKSTLAQLLLGGALPAGSVIPETGAPILFRYAERPVIYMVGEDGARRAVASAQGVAGAPVRYIEACLPLDLLRRAEIVDVPGTSNPATAEEAHALLPHIMRGVHMALWCTTATQAWKGSEQSAWGALPHRLRAASLLVVTHTDRIRQAADREKVFARMRRETSGYFRGVVMISSTQRALTIEHGAPEREKARAEGANMELWYAHGGAALWQQLMDAVAAISVEREQSAERVAARIAAHIAAVLAAQDGKRRAAAAVPERKPRSAPESAPERAAVRSVERAPEPAPQRTAMRPPVRAAERVPERSIERVAAERQAPPSAAPSLQGDYRAALLALWTRRSEAITARIAETPAAALIAEFSGELSNFARDALLPRLEPQLGRSGADAVAALFVCEPSTLAAIAEGLSPDATAQLLRAALAQLGEELAEALTPGQAAR